jgi:hypothetical protein
MPMKQRFLLAAALLAGVLAAGVSLPAQSYRSFREEYDGIRDRVKMRLGPLRLAPTLRLYDVGYD